MVKSLESKAGAGVVSIGLGLKSDLCFIGAYALASGSGSASGLVGDVVDACGGIAGTFRATCIGWRLLLTFIA